MTGQLLRRPRRVDAGLIDRIDAELMRRQYLFPRKPLADVLTELAAALGLTLGEARRAALALQLDPTRSVGRLTRRQLESLARQIHQQSRTGL